MIPDQSWRDPPQSLLIALIRLRASQSPFVRGVVWSQVKDVCLLLAGSVL